MPTLDKNEYFVHFLKPTGLFPCPEGHVFKNTGHLLCLVHHQCLKYTKYMLSRWMEWCFNHRRRCKTHLRTKANRPHRTSKTGVMILLSFHNLSFTPFPKSWILILSGRGITENWAQIPPLMYASTVSPRYKQATPLHTVRLSYKELQPLPLLGFEAQALSKTIPRKSSVPGPKEKCPYVRGGQREGSEKWDMDSKLELTSPGTHIRQWAFTEALLLPPSLQVFSCHSQK